MTPDALNTTAEWPTSRTIFFFFFSTPHPHKTHVWRSGRQINKTLQTLEQPSLFVASMCFLGTIIWQAAPTRTCSLCVYGAPPSLLTAYTQLVLTKWASDNDGNKDEASGQTVTGEQAVRWQKQYAAEEPWGLAVLRHRKVLCLGSSDLWERELSRFFGGFYVGSPGLSCNLWNHNDETVVGSLGKASSFLPPCWLNQSLHALKTMWLLGFIFMVTSGDKLHVLYLK